MNEFLLTLNKKFIRECFAALKCELNKGQVLYLPLNILQEDTE